MQRADASGARSGRELRWSSAELPWSSAKASGVHQAGLTLLEVLGAVALLGILYTALAGGAIEGLRSEGESRRRLEASLLADDRLAEVEVALASGATPPIGAEEEEVEGFTVSTEVRAFELPPRPDEDAARAKPTSLAAKRAAARAKDAPSLFAPRRGPTAPAPLLSIEVVVRWEDGIFQREMRRTTYAVDPTVVEAAFESLGELEPQQPAEEPPGEEGAQDQGTQDQRSRRAGQQRGSPLPQVTPDREAVEP